MRVARLWADDEIFDLAAPVPSAVLRATVVVQPLADAAARCTSAELETTTTAAIGDPTELALLMLARDLGRELTPLSKERQRRVTFHFDAHLQRMSTLDDVSGALRLSMKGAPESVLPLVVNIVDKAGRPRPFEDVDRVAAQRFVDDEASLGLRVLAVAERVVEGEDAVALAREDAESELTLLGLVAMIDPPTPEVAAAIAEAHRAGIRIHVITGDNGLTAAEIARQVGIGVGGIQVMTGEELDRLDESALDELLSSGRELIFARSSPEAKLRITDALRALGEVVAVTGEGVNDAPAPRRAEIGIAMGRSGTDVAREAATMVLTDDNFATIVAAIEGGRRVYDNVRRFIVYIFTHAVPEVALSGGAVRLPLTVMQILAIDLGTDTLPALALSRERAEPGLMDRPPRPHRQGVIVRSMLTRSRGFMGVISAALVRLGFFVVLHDGGWHEHAAVGPAAPLHTVYLQATTIAWLGFVACQIGTAFAVRTERASLFEVGVLSNRLLLGGIGFELAFAAAIVYVPLLHPLFGTADLSPRQLLVVVPYPIIVWGSDELRRLWHRRVARRRVAISPRRAL